MSISIESILLVAVIYQLVKIKQVLRTFRSPTPDELWDYYVDMFSEPNEDF